jgi:hypothetical protein
VRLLRQLLCLGVLAALIPATASAYPTIGPNTHDFGAKLVGTASAPYTFQIHAKCLAYSPTPGAPLECAAMGGDPPFTPNVSVSGPFRIANNGCTATMLQANPYGSYCYFDVVFAPLLPGPATGVIDVGSPYATASVSGTGIPAPMQSSPTPTKKKCKKKGHNRSAAAAKKKCRKKHR